MSLFEYTYTNGTTVSKDILEHPENITELIFVRDKDRFAKDKIRPHESHPVHEAAAKSIPPHVRILRAVGCKLRTFPVLPTNIHECYLSSNHFLALPDLSAYRQLIVLELDIYKHIHNFKYFYVHMPASPKNQRFVSLSRYSYI
jgi:hypothetical protein